MTRKTAARNTYHGIISTGQSLSVGNQARLPGPTPPVPNAYRLQDSQNKYDLNDPNAETLSLQPLSEPLRPQVDGAGQYPTNIEGQTPHSAMAREINRLCVENGHEPLRTLHSAVGINALPMDAIKKGGFANAFEASLFEAEACSLLVADSKMESECDGEGGRVIYEAIVLTHGESDSISQNPKYGSQLNQMQRDYATDLAGITGQKTEPVLILSQENTTSMSPPETINIVTQAQWQVQAESCNKVICAGPKYQYGYVDGLHLPIEGYNRLGEKYGQVFYQTVVQRCPFVPLSPKSARLDRHAVITAVFNVPKPPLRLDEVMDWPHLQNFQEWSQGRGFEVWDAEGKKVTIVDVRIGGEDSVEIELDPRNVFAAAKLPLRVAYAMTQDGGGFQGGTGQGRLGHLCDSEDQVGADAETLECTVETSYRDGIRLSTLVFKEPLSRSRAVHDFVGSGAFQIKEIEPNERKRALLTSYWEGKREPQSIKIWHNHRNFCVSFSMDVLASKALTLKQAAYSLKGS